MYNKNYSTIALNLDRIYYNIGICDFDRYLEALLYLLLYISKILNLLSYEFRYISRYFIRHKRKCIYKVK